MEKLSQAEIEQWLSSHAEWTQEDDKWLVRKYRFDSFAAAIRFVNQVAEVAEAANHHPFLSIDYRVVGVRITSWHAGGLTALDLQCIEQFDEAFRAK